MLLMAEGERILINRKKAVLNREQKTGLGMVLTFGSLALVFGVFYMWKHIASPFVVSYVGPKFLTGDQKQEQQMETLKKEDTDADGLNDYNELYVYKTSPYLKDTDSDGAEDGVEITQGGDPNCAPNMPCATIALDAVSPVTLKGTFAEDIASAAGGASPQEPTDPAVQAQTPVDFESIFSQMSAIEIQNLLIQSGGDPATVKALTEEQLRSALAQAISQLEVQSSLQDAGSGGTADAQAGTDTAPIPTSQQ